MSMKSTSIGLWNQSPAGHRFFLRHVLHVFLLVFFYKSRCDVGHSCLVFFLQPHVLRMYLGYFGFLAHANFDKRNVAFETQGCPGILPKPSAACVLHSQRLVCLAC